MNSTKNTRILSETAVKNLQTHKTIIGCKPKIWTAQHSNNSKSTNLVISLLIVVTVPFFVRMLTPPLILFV